MGVELYREKLGVQEKRIAVKITNKRGLSPILIDTVLTRDYVTMKNYKKWLIVGIVGVVCIGGLLYFSLSSDERKILKNYRSAKEELFETTNKPLISKENGELEFVINRMIINISKSWDFDIVKSYFSPEVLKPSNEDKLRHIVNVYSRLGQFREQLNPQIIKPSPSRPGSQVFYGQFKFESGDAQVTLMLTKQSGKWLLETISITSETLL